VQLVLSDHSWIVEQYNHSATKLCTAKRFSNAHCATSKGPSTGVEPMRRSNASPPLRSLRRLRERTIQSVLPLVSEEQSNPAGETSTKTHYFTGQQAKPVSLKNGRRNGVRVVTDRFHGFYPARVRHFWRWKWKHWSVRQIKPAQL